MRIVLIIISVVLILWSPIPSVAAPAWDDEASITKLAPQTQARKDHFQVFLMGFDKIAGDVLASLDVSALNAADPSAFPTAFLKEFGPAVTALGVIECEADAEHLAFKSIREDQTGVGVSVESKDIHGGYVKKGFWERFWNMGNKLGYALLTANIGGRHVLLAFRYRNAIPDSVWSAVLSDFQLVETIPIKANPNLVAETYVLSKDTSRMPQREILQMLEHRLGADTARKDWIQGLIHAVARTMLSCRAQALSRDDMVTEAEVIPADPAMVAAMVSAEAGAFAHGSLSAGFGPVSTDGQKANELCVVVYDNSNNHKILCKHEQPDIRPSDVAGILVASAELHFVLVLKNGIVKIVDIATGKAIQTLDLSRGLKALGMERVRSVAFGPQGSNSLFLRDSDASKAMRAGETIAKIDLPSEIFSVEVVEPVATEVAALGSRVANVWSDMRATAVGNARASHLLATLEDDPLGKIIRENAGSQMASQLTAFRTDSQKLPLRVVVDLAYIVHTTKHESKENWARVLSRCEEFKALVAQIQELAGGDIVLDILSPFNRNDTQKILSLSEVALEPGQYNMLFADMGIDKVVGSIKDQYRAQIKKDSLTEEETQQIEKRVLFLLSKDSAEHFNVAAQRGKNYQILIGQETTSLTKMIFSGIVLANAVLTGRPDQFIGILVKWYQDNGIAIPVDLPSADSNGFYNVPPDAVTSRGMTTFLNRSKYAQEANVRA